MGVKRWNGSAYTDLDIPKVNNVVPTAAWAWVSGAYVKLWPPVVPQSFADNFDRSDQYLDASANWEVTNCYDVPGQPRSGATVTLQHRAYVTSNRVNVFHNSNDSTTVSIHKWTTPMQTTEQIVQSTTFGSNTTWASWLILNGDSTLTNFVALEWRDTDLKIMKTTDGGTNFTQLAIKTSNVMTSNTVTYQLVKADNVYTIFRNGVSQCTYTDSSRVIPEGKYGGLGITRRRSSFANSVSNQIDNWVLKDTAA